LLLLSFFVGCRRTNDPSLGQNELRPAFGAVHKPKVSTSI